MNHPDNKDNCKATMSSAICEYEASIAKIVLLSINDLEFGLGVNKIAQILTGMQNRFITEHELQKNPGYSIFKHYSKNDVKTILNALIYFDYLVYEEVNYGVEVIKLTKKAESFLRGEEEFDASFIDAITESDFIELDEEQTKLYDELRLLRYSLAKEKEMPAYTVCNDKALYLITIAQPKKEEELLEIKGIGNAFVERYGDQFLETIKMANSNFKSVKEETEYKYDNSAEEQSSFKKSCNNCKCYLKGDCAGMKGLCDDYEYAPHISEEEKKRWPVEMGPYVTGYGTRKRR